MKNLIKKYNLDKSTWTYKGFHGVLHTFFPVGQSGFPMKDFFGDSCKITLFFVKDNYVHWYWNDNDLTRLRNLFFERLKNDSKYLTKIKKLWSERLKYFDSIIATVHNAELSKLSNSDLSKLYDQFYKAYLREYTCLMALGDAISMHADRYVVPEFEKILGQDFAEVFPKLITTKHKSFIDKEREARQKLINIYKKTHSIPENLLKEHSRKYFYILNNYAKAEYLSASDFVKIIKTDAKSKTKFNPKKENKVLRENLIKKYKLSQWQKTLLCVLDEFFGIQDTRKKYVLISNYYQFKFLHELSKRKNIPFELLQCSIYPEFKNILDKGIDTKILENRKKISACVQTPNSYEVIDGKKANELLNHFLNPGENTQTLTGIIASKGKAKGRVKIVLKTHDMINMKKGDILVSSMTRPEMVPAMKKASAIVTDEGGLTCHAAIISRELGIPCIIGTKTATKILKDGDRVEVDADRGTVKIIKI